MPGLLPSSLCTAGRSIFRQRSAHAAVMSSFMRMYSAAAALTRDQVDERVLSVLRAFDRVTKDKVSLDSKFTSDLGLDSLDVVEVMIAMEEEFQLEIPDDVADKCTTPREAAEYIFKTQSE